MDKNILNFLNLAKSTDEFRAHLTHAYASEKHIVTLDGHRMHYVDNAWGVRGFLSPGMEKDATFPPYERLIMSLPSGSDDIIKFDGAGKEDVEFWKLALKEIRTFDHAYFEMRDKTVFLCAKNHDRRTIQKSLSMPIKDCKVAYGFKRSPTVNAQYLSDALSPITYKRPAVSNWFSFHADICDNYPIQLRVKTAETIFRSVLMTIRENRDSEQSKAA